jgi:hypothetical protein
MTNELGHGVEDLLIELVATLTPAHRLPPDPTPGAGHGTEILNSLTTQQACVAQQLSSSTIFRIA